MITSKEAMKTIMFLTGVFTVWNVNATEDIVLNKMGFGRLVWDGERHDKPMAWRYFKDRSDGWIYSGYRISDSESVAEQKKHALYVNLAVKQKGKYVLASVTFKNESIQPYFIHQSRIPSRYLRFFYPLCSNAFLIKTDGILLDYLGSRCEFTDHIHDKLTSWRKINPGKEYHFTIKLNDVYTDSSTSAYAYVFPEGVRRYNIGSLEYSIVNENWFIQQSMYELAFNLLDFKYQACSGDRANHIKKWSIYV